MDSTKPVQVKLRILDKDYVLACPEEERESLLAAAYYLNQKVQEVREGGKVVSNERIIAISALNIVHEYFQYKQQQETDSQVIDKEISHLQEKIALELSRVKE